MVKKKSKKRIASSGPTNKTVKAKKAKKTVRKKATKRSSVSKAKGSSGKANKKPVTKSDSFLWSFVKYWFVRLAVIFAVILLAYTAYLDVKIRNKFEGQKWALPAHVYTRPMELYIGQILDARLLQEELVELGYQIKVDADRVGTYSYVGDKLDIFQREFRFWDGLRASQLTSINFNNGRIESINVDGQDTEIVRLEARLFGSVSPMSHEDRELLTLDEVPQHLIDALIAIEDRQFYSHFGINPLGILRALFRNITEGRVVQGGSTLTQQLIKNYYLTSEQTIERKAKEAIMAVLLELHYSKDEILQAYLNEIHLSQAGNRAIHGFALGSQYFFGRPLQELELPDLALLAGIIKGPSLYNPIRNPQRAEQRRNIVLKTMFDEGVITEQEYTDAIVVDVKNSATATRAAPMSYPAFMGLVRENLQDDYRQEDLFSDGLQIYTTLNPRIQKTLEKSVQGELDSIEKSRNIQTGTLQVAAVVIRTDNGEIAAMVGDRKASFQGFNRALSARRPVGSLLKPFIYLSALEDAENYSLATSINDEAIVVSQQGSADWLPQNYDGKEHGQVMLIDALSRSYNLATVQLGMSLGIPKVIETVKRVGYKQDIPELPSLLLGAVPMSVIDVSQLYLTLASGGFKLPIKAIRSVLSNDNESLARYPLNIEQVIEPEFSYMINYALQDVIRNGTGRGVLNGFQYDYGLAGKTGTTDDYRDSWFAGFSGNYLTVVWVGRDDNQSTGLTGASGAAKIWSKTMQEMSLQRLELGYHEEIISQKIYYSADPFSEDCSLSRQLPILSFSLPLKSTVCAERIEYDVDNGDAEKHFESQAIPQTRPQRKKSLWERIFKR